jgi:hypothetical protein
MKIVLEAVKIAGDLRDRPLGRVLRKGRCGQRRQTGQAEHRQKET